MNQQINRRDLMTSGTLCALGLGLAAPLVLASSSALAAQPDNSDFAKIMRASSGAVAANFSDFAVQSPEGNTCTARIAYPLVVTKKLPVLVFCPDEGASANRYDSIIGPLAAQDYFVLAIDRRPASSAAGRSFLTPEQQSDQNLRRYAEARFLLDTIDAASAALGANSEMVDTSRVGAIGHGDGAWIAAGLGGWDSNGAPTTRTRDGRVYAVYGLTPSRSATPAPVSAQRSPDGVSGMFAGNLSQMPTPTRDSGLIGLGLPINSISFGGLIGTVSAAEARRLEPEHQALAAAISSATLFFDWTLRGDRGAKKELLALNGRRVEGLAAPLSLRKA